MKAQVSIEYMSFIGILLMLLALASYAAVSATADITWENERAEARSIASLIAGEINIAVSVGDGYSHTFTVPALFRTGTPFFVNLSGTQSVTVQWGNSSYYQLPVLAAVLNGNITSGTTVISNVNGVIVFA